MKTPPTSWDVFYSDEYKGRILGYDNGEHNFSVTALDMGIENPFHLSRRADASRPRTKLIDMKHNLLSLYSTADEALQLYQQNDVALIWANYGQQQVKMMKDAGAPIAYVNAKEGALAWLDTWAMTSGVKNKELAEKWVELRAAEEDLRRAVRAQGFGNTVVEFPSAGAERQDRLAARRSRIPTKRADLWNEIKAAP